MRNHWVRYLVIGMLAATLCVLAASPQAADASIGSIFTRQIAALRSQINTLRISVGSQALGIAGLQSVNTSQTSQLDSLRGASVVHSNDIGSLQTRVASAEVTSAVQSNMIGGLTESATAQAARIASVEASQTSQDAYIGFLEGRIAALESLNNDFWPAAPKPTVGVTYGGSSVLFTNPPQVWGRYTLNMNRVAPSGQPQQSPVEYNTLMMVSGDELSPSTQWIYGDDGYVTCTSEPVHSPVTIEYWVEGFGQRLHGTQVIPARP